ncbi:MAG TPA: DNA repair protein RecO [Thermodesulfovibrionales bacterium]|nr:DNA repair protein RecO [Thermodesulfovibrionales bacterium]
MLHRTEGIVLRTIPFGDADLIVSFLTPDLGLLKTFAKSPLKTKSRFGSSLEPLTHSRIAFWGKEDTTLPRLTQSDIIHSFQSMRDTLNCFIKVSEIIELTLQFIPEREANTKVYALFLHTLHNIENNPTSPPFNSPLSKGGYRGVKEGKGGLDIGIIHYKIHFLKLTGYAPKLDTCGRCGKDGQCFYLSQGSIICKACAKGVDFPVRITQGTMKLYSALLTWDITKIQRIRPPHMLLSELSDLIDMHIKHILMKPLKSETFIRSLSRHL